MSQESRISEAVIVVRRKDFREKPVRRFISDTLLPQGHSIRLTETEALARAILQQVNEASLPHVLKPNQSSTLCGAPAGPDAIKAVAMTYMAREVQERSVCPDCFAAYRKALLKGLKGR